MNIDELNENKILIKKYRNLIRKAKTSLKEGESRKIGQAFRFALLAHKDMRRKSGEPFIYHPVEVAHIVAGEIGLDAISIIGALLHDVVEDTKYELQDIEKKFGKEVTKIIDGLTKIKRTSNSGASLQAENFRKLLFTISQDIRIIKIKIADRLHNMRTLDSMPKRKQLKIQAETQFLYVPLAYRLGLYSIKSELEDLSFKYSDRNTYEEIRNKIEETQAERTRFIRNFIRPIEKKLREVELKFRIRSRVKSIYSIYNKMKERDISFEEIYDLFAVRIILNIPLEDEIDVCWRVYSIITKYYTPNYERLRDWIGKPKSNGYESLHTTVMGRGQWVEVQIRSERMDDIAEKGYAAHWRYKGIQDDKLWLGEIKEALQDKNLNADELVGTFKSNLHINEIYAFTTDGKITKLPQGSTIIDFAYQIRKKLGQHTLAAKINRKLVSLDYKIQNGDQVEIITSKKVKINRIWLTYAVTLKARNHIKRYLKEDEEFLIPEGKKIIRQYFKHDNIPTNKENLIKYFGLSSEDELYYCIGEGTISQEEIKNFVNSLEEENKNSNIESKNRFNNKINKINNGVELIIKKNDLDLGDYKILECCQPIPGDPIFGFIIPNKKIEIHRTNCSGVIPLMANHGDRIVKLRWNFQEEKKYEFSVSLEGVDRIGIINDITEIISKRIKANIKEMIISTQGSIFRGSLTLFVKNQQESIRIIEAIESIDGILRVSRKESINAI